MKRFGLLLLGLLLALGGLAAAGFGLVGALGEGPDETRFMAGTAGIPFGIMLLEVGLATIWLTIRGLRGQQGRAATLPPWWACALIFGLAVGGGFWALREDIWWLFLPLATVVVFAPVAAAGRLGLPSAGVRPGWGRLLGAFCWGALVTPVLAILVQFVAIGLAAGAAFLGLSYSGQQNLRLIADTWTYRLQGRNLTEAQAAELLQFVLRQPLVLAVGAVVLVLAAPISEELGKFVAAPLFGRTRMGPGVAAIDPPLTIFLIGLASGLGFAATENIFYIAQAGETGWTLMAVVRSATPIMHGTACAVFALGWARQHQRPRSWALVWGALGSFGLHGAWNLCAGLVIVAGVFATAAGTATVVAAVLLVGSLVVLGGLLLLSVSILLRQRSTLAQEANASPPPSGPSAPPNWGPMPPSGALAQATAPLAIPVSGGASLGTEPRSG